MATFTKAGGAIRQAVGYIMLAPELGGVLCNFDHFVRPLGVLGGGLGSDDFAEVTADLIQTAFRRGEDNYYIPFSELGVVGCPEGDFFLGRIGYRPERTKFNELCRLPSLLPNMVIPECGAIDTNDHPLDSNSFQRRVKDLVPAPVQEALGDSLKKMRKEQKRKAARAKADKAKKEKAEAKESAKRAKRQAAKKAKSISPVPSPKKKSPAKKKRRKLSRKLEVEELALLNDINQLKARIVEDAAAYRAKKQELAKKIAERLARQKEEDERQRQARRQRQRDEEGDNREEKREEDDAEGAVEGGGAEDGLAGDEEAVPEQDPAHYDSPDDEPDLLDEEERDAEARAIAYSLQLVEEGNLAASKTVGSGKPLYFSVQGRAGWMKLASDDIIFVDELKAALDPLHPNHDNEKSESVRERTNWEKNSYGANATYLPNRTAMVAKSYLTELKEAKKIVKKMEDLFRGGQCGFSREALLILAAHNLHNYGGSDEATEMVVAGTLLAFFHDIGFDISEKQLAKGCPSQTTIRRAEWYLATDTLMVKLQEMRDDGAKWVGLITDHGHRSKQDHFVIVLIWAGWNAQRQRTLKYFCPSTDSAGHSADQAADGVQKVVQRVLGEEFRVLRLTGDSGGGGRVQLLGPKLRDKSIMPAEPRSKIANCCTHGMQKVIQNPSESVMGTQGMGCRTPFQMVFVFSVLIATIRERGGHRLLDSIWSVVMEKMATDESWDERAMRQFKQAWRDFKQKLDSFDEFDKEGIEQLIKFMTEAPRDIQDPVWSRWGSIIKTIEVFLDNYPAIYFLAHGIKMQQKSEAYLWKVACTLISLMNERAQPILSGDVSIDEYIESFSDENVDSRLGAAPLPDSFELKPGDTPTFYAMLLFHRAFCKAAFNDNFSFMLRNDPYFGPNTYGQVARLMGERLFVIYKNLTDLQNGGWKSFSEFNAYKEALKGVPRKGLTEHAADLAYFEKMAEDFIAEALRNVYEHLNVWRSNELLPYLVAADPEIAKAFCGILVNHDEEPQAHVAPEDDADTTIQQVLGEAAHVSSVPDKVVTLGEHHKLTRGDVTVNVRECMTFLTKDADLKSIRQDPLIDGNWELIKKLATVTQTVHLFDKKEDGSIDKSTWGSVDYEPLIDVIWREVAIHSNHQQRCENYVQMAAIIARTLIGEKRRTWRAITVSAIIRTFNIEAVEELRAAEKDDKKRAKITRASGANRVRLFAKYINNLMKQIGRARVLIEEARYKEIRASLADAENKQSAADGKQFDKEFEKSVNAAWKTYAAELVSGYNVTAQMGGKVLLRILTKTNHLEPTIDCELLERRIPSEMAEWIEKLGEDVDLREVGILDKKKYLKLHEVRRVMKENTSLSEDDAMKTTNAILPFSEEMKVVLTKQNEILAKKKDAA